MRKTLWLFSALCVLAVLGTSEVAGPAGLSGFEAHAYCVSPSASLAAVPSPRNLTHCLDGAWCSTSQDCANLCTEFATATCVEGQCRYTGGGSGGGGGTGGGTGCNIPTPMECESYQQCVCQRPNGIYDFGQCIGGYCQF